MNEDLLKRVVELYFIVKRMLLFADETAKDFNEFLQPGHEVNRAFDHLTRAMAQEYGIGEKVPDPKFYIDKNLRKAVGHLYRAGFDVLDWISMEIRDSLIESFSPFSQKCLSDVLPQYYREVRPDFEKISEDIAEIRAKKDVDNDKAVDLLREYFQIVRDLNGKVINLKRRIPILSECEERCRKEHRKVWLERIAIAVISVALTALLSSIFR